MSTKRIVIGNIGGQFDCRISRRGYHADTADVNDNRQISFAASRPTFAYQAEAGDVSAYGAWQWVSQVYGVLMAVGPLVNNENNYMGLNRRWQRANGGYTETGDGTVAVVASDVLNTDHFMISNTVWYVNNVSAGDSFRFMVIGT